MATRLTADQLRSVIRARLESAARELESAPGREAEAIHEARKSLKQTRAFLHLLQVKNPRLGELGRALSDYRDAAAMVETIDLLLESQPSPTLRRLRRAFLKRQSEAEQSPELRALLPKVAAHLRHQAEVQIDAPAGHDDSLAAGLQQTYRKGRRALRQAEKDPTPETFHDLRKRAKDYLYQLGLINGRHQTIQQLKRLETWLGNDHNLALLQPQIEKPGTLRLIAKVQANLRRKSLAQAKQLYKKRPSKLVHAVEN